MTKQVIGLATSVNFNGSGHATSWEAKTYVQCTCCKPHAKVVMWRGMLSSMLHESWRMFSWSSTVMPLMYMICV